jgi:hypothetical protein
MGQIATAPHVHTAWKTSDPFNSIVGATSSTANEPQIIPGYPDLRNELLSSFLAAYSFLTNASSLDA